VSFLHFQIFFLRIELYSIVAAFTYPLTGKQTVEKVEGERWCDEQQEDPEPKPTDFSGLNFLSADRTPAFLFQSVYLLEQPLDDQ
jgi:hypothetical protein